MRWRHQETTLTLCALAFFVTMVGRLAVSPVVPDIAADLNITNSLIGVALTAMWGSYAVIQFPSGILADRFGERPVILASVVGTGLTTLVIATSPTFAIFLLGTILVGAVTGLHYSVATALLTRTYDDMGTAISVHDAGGPLAGLVAPIAVAWVAVSYGWRVAIGLSAALAVPVAALFWWQIRPTVPRRPDQPMRDQFALEPIVTLLSRRSILFTVITAVLLEFTWQGVASFLPTFLIQYKGFSQTMAGSLFAVYFVANGVLGVGVGALADRFSRDFATATCMVTGISGLTILVVLPGLGWALGGVILVGFSMGWAGAVFARFMDHLSEAERSSGFGLVRTAYMIIAAPGSVAIGVLSDLFGWAFAIGFLIALLGIVLGQLTINRVLKLGY